MNAAGASNQLPRLSPNVASDAGGFSSQLHRGRIGGTECAGRRFDSPLRSGYCAFDQRFAWPGLGVDTRETPTTQSIFRTKIPETQGPAITNLLGWRSVVLRLLLWRLLLLLLCLVNAVVLRLDHGVELTLLLVAGQSGANLIDRRLPELVDLL